MKETTLEAVKKGILTDEQLKEGLEHYKKLDLLLSCHGVEYQLIKRDVREKMETLAEMQRQRGIDNFRNKHIIRK